MGMLLIPQKIIHEERNPISRLLQRVYEPFFRLALAHPWIILCITLIALASTWFPFSKLGTEFMPPLDEGDLLYMPTTNPSISITKSKQLLQQTDKLIRTLPEVISVHGKIGRAETATDPAPLSMIETVVQLNPNRAEWRTRQVKRFFSGWPDWLKAPLKWVLPEVRPITTNELRVGWDDPDGAWHPGINEIVNMPGVAN